MALSLDEKRIIRAQFAAYLGDIQNVKCVQDAKPDAQEYYGFLAVRLIKKLRLDNKTVGTAEDDAVVATKPAADDAQAAAKALEQSTNKLVNDIIDKPAPKPKAKPAAKAKAAPKPRLSQVK